MTAQRNLRLAVYAAQEAGDQFGCELTSSDLERLIAAARPLLLPDTEEVKALKEFAQRLYAPAGHTPFPTREQFNEYATRIITLCDQLLPEETP